MSEIPLSSSPFLSSPVKQKDYAFTPSDAPTPDPIPTAQPEATVPTPESVPKIETEGKKKVVVKGSAPPPPPDVPQVEYDQDVPLFEYDESLENDVMDTADPEVEGLEEAAMSTIQARETAKAFVMVFNQVFTLIGIQACTIDEDSVARAIMLGELPKLAENFIKEANERTRGAIPFDPQQQKELVRALIIILKESNFSSISPSTMAWISILTVVGVHTKNLVDLRNQNKNNLMALIKTYSGTSRYTQQDSSIPEEKPEQRQSQNNVPQERRAANTNQKVA